VLLVRLYDGDGHVRLAVPARALAVFVPLAVVGFVVLVLGTVVTGTGPHSGDAGEVPRIALNPMIAARFHAVAVYAFSALLLVQGVVDYVQYCLGPPERVVVLHVIGAALFAASIAWVGARLVTWQEPGATRDMPEAPATAARDITEAR